MDRAGAVDRDRYLSYTLGSDSRQIHSSPDVAPVGPNPAVERRNGVGPGTAQKLTPVYSYCLRRFERSLCAGRQFYPPISQHSPPVQPRSANPSPARLRIFFRHFQTLAHRGPARCLPVLMVLMAHQPHHSIRHQAESDSRVCHPNHLPDFVPRSGCRCVPHSSRGIGCR